MEKDEKVERRKVKKRMITLRKKIKRQDREIKKEAKK